MQEIVKKLIKISSILDVTKMHKFSDKIDGVLVKLAYMSLMDFPEFYIVGGKLIDISRVPGLHKGVVVRYIFNLHGIKDQEEYNLLKQDSEDMYDDPNYLLKEKGFTDEEIIAIEGKNDEAKEYAASQYGWIRISGCAIIAPDISSYNLNNIAKSLEEIYGPNIDKEGLDFNIWTTSGIYNHVSFDSILMGPSEVNGYKEKIHTASNFKKKIPNNKFIKLAQEEWPQYYIIDGNLIDLKNNDLKNNVSCHGEYIQKYIINQHGLTVDEYDSLETESLEKYNNPQIIPREKGFSEEEFNIISGRVDPVDWATKHLGWIRISRNEIQTPNLSPINLELIANALKYINANDKLKYWIMTPIKNYYPVPLSVILSGKLGEIKHYRDSNKINKFIKLAFNDIQYWLIDGQLMDVKHLSSSHASYVRNFICKKHGLSGEDEFFKFLYTMNNDFKVREKFKKIGFTDDELDVMTQKIMAIDYGVNHYQWIRIHNNSLYFPNLLSSTINEIIPFLHQIYGSNVRNTKFNIYVPNNAYFDVDYNTLMSKSVREIRDYSLAKTINNKFIRLAQTGEFWIQEGTAMYADGDIGDMNHEGYVIEAILNNYELDYDKMMEIDKTANPNDPDAPFRQLGMSQEEIDTVHGRNDARIYGFKNLGWQRVNGSSVETEFLTPKDMHSIANGLWDAYSTEMEDEDAGDMEFDIEVASTRAWFRDVPYSVIETKDPSKLLPYR
jgi:hypothetical protein